MICPYGSPFLPILICQIHFKKLKLGSFALRKAYGTAAMLLKYLFSRPFQCRNEFAVGNTSENHTQFSVAGPRITRGTHAEHKSKFIPLDALGI